MASTPTAMSKSSVTCRNNDGAVVEGTVVKLTRYQAVFEVYNPGLVLHLSEVLADFKIVISDRQVYAGRAVVANVLNTGSLIVCEVSLDEESFSLLTFSATPRNGELLRSFQDFIGEWQKLYKVRKEFKVVVADMQTFLTDLRLWLNHLELEIRADPGRNRVEVERAVAREIGDSMVPAFDAMHERYEAISSEVEEELRPVHHNYSKRQLHPLVMCSPFAFRTYSKPLGYAGDYEMVNMIMRDPHEGPSLFAKVVNRWFLNQWPAQAHRNRIQYLKDRLRNESLRGALRGRPVRILNLGCGPAREIEEFLLNDPASDHAEFTLLDFNEETIQHTKNILNEAKRRAGRRTAIHLQKKSVHQVLKEGSKMAAGAPKMQYDFIYSAGLFDYLSDRTCKLLLEVFYEGLTPGGLLAATNVDASRPFRHMLEFVLDWHLIYRDGRQGAAIMPERAPKDAILIHTDETGVNLFMEARKPQDG